MPKRTSNPTYRTNRAIILQGNPPCALCGKPGADTADHIIPHDAGGSDHIDNLRPAHHKCNSKAGARYGNAKRAAQQIARNEAVRDQQISFLRMQTPPTASFSLSEGVQGETDGSARIVSSLPGVGRIEPRLVSVVGVSESFGPEVAEWSEKYLGKTLMGWQRVALDGQLAHDESGALLHREALISCARQQGKSVALTALIGWALTRWPVHRGEPVHVLSVANKLDRAVAIFLELCDILEAHGAKVTRAYGRNKVVMPDGSTWEVRAAVPGLHGMSPTLIVVDELWNISEDVFFDALRPSQIAQRSPLMSCWSTAGDEGSKAMLRLREQALAAIDAGKATKLFFAEWSMPPGAQPMDPANWGWANPALGTTVTLEALRAAAETPDRGAFLRAHCNLWVSAADAWLPPGMWEKRDGGACDEPGGVLVIESAVDESKFIGVRCRALEGRTHVQIEFVADSSFQMWAEIDRLMVDPKLILAIAAGLEIHTPERLRSRRTIWGYAEVLKWTGLVRSMVLEGRIVHDGGSMLAEHVNRAVLTRAQGSVVLSSQRSPGPIEAARAMVVGAALVSAPAQRGKAVMGFAR